MIESTVTVGVQELVDSLIGSEDRNSTTEASPMDVVNFEQEFAEMDKAESSRIPDSNFSTSPNTIDLGGGSVSHGMAQGVVEMDANYRNAIRSLEDKPSFGSYLEKHGVSLEEMGGGEQTGTQHVSNVDDVKMSDKPEAVSLEEIFKGRSEKLESMLETNRAYNAAGIDYSVDMMRWYQQMQLWLGKVKVLGTAVSLTSRGLKTLFTSQ